MTLPAPPRQSDRDRRRYFDGFQRRFPGLPLRWGNTFARWCDVPGTELVVSHCITNHAVGVFVRGQRGVPAIETAAQLPVFSLEIALKAPLGRPDFPFVTALPFDVFDEAGWPASHDWLFAAGERYVAALAEVVGGLRLEA
jgi:hypothetical protein